MKRYSAEEIAAVDKAIQEVNRTWRGKNPRKYTEEELATLAGVMLQEYADEALRGCADTDEVGVLLIGVVIPIAGKFPSKHDQLGLHKVIVGVTPSTKPDQPWERWELDEEAVHDEHGDHPEILLHAAKLDKETAAEVAWQLVGWGYMPLIMPLTKIYAMAA